MSVMQQIGAEKVCGDEMRSLPRHETHDKKQSHTWMHAAAAAAMCGAGERWLRGLWLCGSGLLQASWRKPSLSQPRDDTPSPSQALSRHIQSLRTFIHAPGRRDPKALRKAQKWAVEAHILGWYMTLGTLQTGLNGCFAIEFQNSSKNLISFTVGEWEVWWEWALQLT